MGLTLGEASTIGVLVASWCLATGCGGDAGSETVIVDRCGPGTILDRSANLCVPLNDVDSGASGAGGGASGSGGSGASTGGDASGGESGAAGTGMGGDAGAAGAGQAGAAASGGSGATGWVDDDCGSYAPDTLLSQADSHCPNYDPQGVCAMSTTLLDMAPLHLADFEATGELIVRTPSNPGSKPQCEAECTGPGAIAKVRIPIQIGTQFSDPDVITIDHVGLGGNQTGDPWRIVYAYQEADGSDGCSTPKPSDCQELRATQVVISLETDDPNAPAREFRLMYKDAGGFCQ